MSGLGVRSSPPDDPVLGDGGVGTGLEGGSVVLGHVHQGVVREPVDPHVGPGRKGTGGRRDVGRLAVIVPGQDLRKLDPVTHGDDLFPSVGVEEVVRSVDPVLIPSPGREVGEEVRGDGGHVLLVTERGHVLLVARGVQRGVAHGPTRVPVELSVHPLGRRKGRRVREDAGNKEDVGTDELERLLEHGVPSIGGGRSTERAVFTGKGRDQDLAIVQSLRRALRKRADERDQGSSVDDVATGHGGHVEGEEHGEITSFDSGSVSVGDSSGLPPIGSHVEREPVDSGSFGSSDVLGPVGFTVRVGVSDHVVGVDLVSLVGAGNVGADSLYQSGRGRSIEID